MNDSKKYNRIKLVLGLIQGIISFILIILFTFSKYNFELEKFAYSVFSNSYLAMLLYVLIIGIALSIITAPFGFYADYILEHKYKLSNQSFSKYLSEKVKGIGVSAIIGIPILLIFYFFLNYDPIDWWLYTAGLVFLFSVLLAQLAPVLIFPIFYKFTPLDNEELEDRIGELCEKTKFYYSGIFSFNLSKNTKKANAGFTGIGPTKRIILSDTLLNNYSPDEIETVFAHELGHYKRKHIWKNILIGMVVLLITFYIVDESFYWISLPYGITDKTRLAGLPVFAIVMSIINFILMPFSNYISRQFEYQADIFAVDITYKPDVLINTLKKLGETNLADKNPHPLVEFLFYSHPSIENRTKAIINRYGERETE